MADHQPEGDATARAFELLRRCGVATSGMDGAEATRRAGEIARAAAEYAAAPESASGPDIAAVFDAHMAAEFEQKDVDATMATMVDEPYLNHVAVMTGGRGRAEVRRFYRDHFIPRWPADTRVTPVSRTVGRAQVVDELVLRFTHDVEMDFLLPGVAPTGRAVELPTVVVVGFEEGRVAREHIYWDQASALVQTGLLDPAGLPVTGVEQARKMAEPSLPPNALIARWDGGP